MIIPLDTLRQCDIMESRKKKAPSSAKNGGNEKMEKYFKLSEESIESIIEHLNNELWSGAKDRIESATEEQKERVADNLREWFFGGLVTDTQINDYVWFECDDIFYPEESEEEEEEEEEETQEITIKLSGKMVTIEEETQE